MYDYNRIFYYNHSSSSSAFSGLPDVGDHSGEDIPVFRPSEQFSHASHVGPFPYIVLRNKIDKIKLKQSIFITSQDVTKVRDFPALDIVEEFPLQTLSNLLF